MTAIEKKPRIAGVAGTIAFWAAFLLLSTIFSLFARKPVYKTVQIRLDSPQTQTQQARAAAAPKATESVAQAAPSAQSSSAPQTVTQPPAPIQTAPAQSASKPATSKPAQSTTKPATSAKPTTQTAMPPTTAKKLVPEAEKFEPQFFDPMEQFAKNTAQKTTATAEAIDWDTVAENSSPNGGATQQNAQTNTVSNALSGSAATAKNGENTATSATSGNQNTSATASSGTSAALSKITATQYTKTAGNGVSSTVTAETGNTADGTAIKMADGATRTLWNPKKPEIDLTDVSSLIDSDKKLQIQFSITPAGDVSLSSIHITPVASVPESVRRKIESQISTWKFTKGDTTNTALLPYTITIQRQ